MSINFQLHSAYRIPEFLPYLERSRINLEANREALFDRAIEILYQETTGNRFVKLNVEKLENKPSERL